MSILRAATPDDLGRLWAMIEDSLPARPASGEAEKSALTELLSNPALGQLFLVGPSQAPVGFLALSFGYSIARGGRTASIDQIFIRERVRGRGLGGQILSALPAALAAEGIRHISLEVGSDDASAQRFFAKAGFSADGGRKMMHRAL